MSQPLGVIFDIDGVLVDSYHAHFESWRALAGRYGLEMTEKQFAATFGRTSREIIAELWHDRDLTEADKRRLDGDKEAAYREAIARDFPEMEGADRLIRELHAAGFRMAVGSSGPPENVALVLERLPSGALLQARVSGADVTRGKPDPQVFLIAADRLGVPPRRCAVIEDARPGIRAATAAGMAAIGLLSTGHREDELSEADLAVRSLGQLSADAIRSLIVQRKA